LTDTSKTEKMIKRWYQSASHCLSVKTVNVLLNNITFYHSCCFWCVSQHVVKLQFFDINMCCFIIIRRDAETSKGMWIYNVCSHECYHAHLWSKGMYNYLIRARSCDVIEHVPIYTLIAFPIAAPLEPSLYLQAFSRYSAPNCLSSANRHCACAISRDLYPLSKISVHILVSHPTLPIHYDTFIGLWRRIRGVYSWDL